MPLGEALLLIALIVLWALVVSVIAPVLMAVGLSETAAVGIVSLLYLFALVAVVGYYVHDIFVAGRTAE